MKDKGIVLRPFRAGSSTVDFVIAAGLPSSAAMHTSEKYPPALLNPPRSAT
jgi:hypothetical protein